jgi:beta-glucanase (GH16 family)
VDGYNLYRNDQYFTTVKGSTNYTDNELSANNAYSFRIVAFVNGEYSGKSAEVSVSTGDASTSASAPSPPPPQNDSGSSNGVPDGYELVFSDEFDDGRIYSDKWNTQYRWGPNLVINNEQQYYVDLLNDQDFGHSPFYMNDGKLNISATRTPDHLRGKAGNQSYLSGAMTTYNKFKMKYGYVEMRARLPRGKGIWPAFWLLHQDNNGNKPEIDVMELLGDNTRLVYQTYHYFDNSTLRSTPSFQAPGPDYASDFHTFGMKWEPGKIVWYIDGQETNRYESGNVSSEEMYILMNVAVGGAWAGSPDGSTQFPATFSIDYVRAYQQR